MPQSTVQRMFPRVTGRLLIGLAALQVGESAPGQEPSAASSDAVSPRRPLTQPLGHLKPDQSGLRELANRAKVQAIEDLKGLGVATARIDKLSGLSPSRFIERLAVQPAVGPSAIAAPKPGTSVPSPSVNWVGDKGGATTGHPGVALLLARRDGTDAFNVYCSGTLIRQNLILSATHCVCYSRNQGANYPTGSFCSNGDANAAPAALLDPHRWRAFFQHAGLREIKKVEINDHYVFGDASVRGDIAVFVLSRPVVEINPPEIPAPTDAAPTWAKGLVVGFGYSANPNAPTAAMLQQLIWPGLKSQGEVSSTACSGEQYLDPLASLCSQYRPSAGGGSQATVCNGDSGGPLWQSGAPDLEIGVTSGRNDDNCAANHTVAFQMSTAYRSHWDWIDARLTKYGSPTVKGRWPAFGENLRFVLDRRNVQLFNDQGGYQSEGWMSTPEAGPVLGTINSSGPITHFELQDRNGKTLCVGLAGAARNVPNVDYCWVSIVPGTEFRVVARGTANESLQWVVTRHAGDTSFAQ